MTQRDILLQAARALEQPFTRSALFLAAWKLNPTEFGLPGHEEQHLDAHTLQSVLYARHGPLRRGELVKDGTRFRLPTAEESALHRPPAAQPGAPQLGRPKLGTRLQVAWNSRAFLAFSRGDKDGITFAHAVEFYGVERITADAVAEALAMSDILLQDRDVGPEVRALGACHDYLQQRFERHFALTRARSAG